MPIRRNAALAGAATLAALAAPGAASAATLAPLKPCYVAVPSSPPQLELVDDRRQPATRPNSRVDIAVDGVPAVTGAPVDAAGNLAPGVAGPGAVRRPARQGRSPSRRPTRATRRNVATATSQVTALNVGIQPRRGAARRAASASAAAASPAPARSTRTTAARAGRAGRCTVHADRALRALHHAASSRSRSRAPARAPGRCSSTSRSATPACPRASFVRLTINVTRTVRFSRALEGFGLPASVGARRDERRRPRGGWTPRRERIHLLGRHASRRGLTLRPGCSPTRRSAASPRREVRRRPRRLDAEGELAVGRVHPDAVAGGEVALEQAQREPVDQVLLDDALERPGPVGRVVAQVARAARGPPR